MEGRGKPGGGNEERPRRSGGKGEPSKHFPVHFSSGGLNQARLVSLFLCVRASAPTFPTRLSSLGSRERGAASLRIPFSASCLFTASDLLVGGCRPSHRDARKHRVFSVCVHSTTLFLPLFLALPVSSTPSLYSCCDCSLSSHSLFHSVTRRLLVDFSPLKPVICSPKASAICAPLHELSGS